MRLSKRALRVVLQVLTDASASAYDAGAHEVGIILETHVESYLRCGLRDDRSAWDRAKLEL